MSRTGWRDYFLAQAKICQVTTDSRSLVIVQYTLALLLSQEQDRVEIWHQIGVKLGELIRPLNRKRARWLTSLADYCLRKGLRHADLSQNGAIRRDRAELLSKVGRFEEAQSQIRQSAKILLLADDAPGLALTRISRAIVYYRWSQAIADRSKRSMLLHQAQNGLKRSVGILETSQRYKKLFGALLWQAEVCISLFELEGEWCWLAVAGDAIIAGRRVAAFGSAEELEHADTLWRRVSQTVYSTEVVYG